jgi:hypothetical protein
MQAGHFQARQSWLFMKRGEETVNEETACEEARPTAAELEELERGGREASNRQPLVLTNSNVITVTSLMMRKDEESAATDGASTWPKRKSSACTRC